MDSDGQWILITYSLPAEPSRKRVLVWRHLRKLGAVHLETGIWVLPHTPELAAAIEPILTEIRELAGKVNAFVASDVDAEQSQTLRRAYNAVRREEYGDLLQMCERYLSHVERRVKAGDFRFSGVEELEEDLEKRRHALAQIVARDAFGIEAREEVEACLRRCDEALARFVEQVYLAGESAETVEP